MTVELVSKGTKKTGDDGDDDGGPLASWSDAGGRGS